MPSLPLLQLSFSLLVSGCSLNVSHLVFYDFHLFMLVLSALLFLGLDLESVIQEPYVTTVRPCVGQE